MLLFLNFAIGVNKPELLDHLLLQIIARQLDRISANKGLARAKGACIVWCQPRICRRDLHIGQGNAQTFCRNLALHRLASLSDIGRTDKKMDGGIGIKHNNSSAQSLL